MTGTNPLPAQHPSLEFSDSASCRHWLEQLTLTNVRRTQRVLAVQLAGLRVTGLLPLERLKVLETLRSTVEFVQGEAARRYQGRPLPFAAAEHEAWRDAQALWQEIGLNYELCRAACRADDPTIAPHAPVVTLRCLETAACAMADHFRCYQRVPARLWRSLHDAYAFAEQHGFARLRIEGPFAEGAAQASCSETYLRVLLAELANPYSLTGRQYALVERWLERWAPLVSLNPLRPANEAIPPVAVDLVNGDDGVLLAAGLPASPGLRYLDLDQLSRRLRQTIALLKQGQTPAELGLGADVRQPGGTGLLMLLYVQWCRAGLVRGEGRTASADPVHVCIGLAGAYRQLSGGREVRAAGELTALEKRELATTGYLARVQEREDADDPDLEVWLALNQSSSGFLCVRRPPEARGRISLNQLLALRLVGKRQFSVGLVQWLRMEDDGTLQCGVRLFPGVAAAVPVRPSNYRPPGGGGGYERALLLKPATDAPGTPPTLIVAPGWFQSGRFLELHTGQRPVAKLVSLLEKGSDFDRGTIVLI